MSSDCKCDCFECRVKRHDICRHVIKCIRRPWTRESEHKHEIGAVNCGCGWHPSYVEKELK